MATKMRTGRMTVKTTTKPSTGIKPKVTTTPEVTVKGKMEKDAYKMTAQEQYAKYGNNKWSDTYSDIGRKTKTSRLTADELKAFRKSEREGYGSKLIPKEVRVSPTLSAKDRSSADNARLGQYQVDYFDPNKDKAVYEADSRRRYAEEGSPVMKTRKLTSSNPQIKLAPKKKEVEMVPKAIEGPSGKGRQMKKNPKVFGTIQKNKLTKTDLNIKGQIQGVKFRKEAKLAGAYERTKSLADEGQGPKVVAGAFSKEKKSGYKDMRSDLRAARKETGVKVGSAIRDTRKAQKFEKKEQAGKTKYFTKSKMAETVKKTPSMKGRMQAGKMRYS